MADRSFLDWPFFEDRHRAFAAELEAWDDFNADWRVACEAIPSESHAFHASDFFYRSPSGFRKEPYQGWSSDDDERLIGSLIGVIHRHGLEKVGGAVDVEAFRSYSVGERMFFTGARFEDGEFQTSGSPDRPYFVGFHAAISNALRLAPDGATVHFVFDRNPHHVRWSDELHRDLILLLERFGTSARQIGRIAFGVAAEEPGLQAADLRAHLWSQIFEREEGVSEERLGSAILLEGDSRVHGVFDAQHLELSLANLPEETRQALRAFRTTPRIRR